MFSGSEPWAYGDGWRAAMLYGRRTASGAVARLRRRMTGGEEGRAVPVGRRRSPHARGGLRIQPLLDRFDAMPSRLRQPRYHAAELAGGGARYAFQKAQLDLHVAADAQAQGFDQAGADTGVIGVVADEVDLQAVWRDLDDLGFLDARESLEERVQAADAA